MNFIMKMFYFTLFFCSILGSSFAQNSIVIEQKKDDKSLVNVSKPDYKFVRFEEEKRLISIYDIHNSLEKQIKIPKVSGYEFTSYNNLSKDVFNLDLKYEYTAQYKKEGELIYKMVVFNEEGKIILEVPGCWMVSVSCLSSSRKLTCYLWGEKENVVFELKTNITDDSTLKSDEDSKASE